MMTGTIYQLLQNIIPELKAQEIPKQMDDFHAFSDWLNKSNNYMQYVELKEFYDNGIEDNEFLKLKHVNTQALQVKVQSDVGELYERLDESMDDLQDVDAYMVDRIEVEQQVEDILFDNIKAVAQDHQLSLLVIFRENPYWMLLPTQDEQVLDQILDVFNQTFNTDGDLNMARY